MLLCDYEAGFINLLDGLPVAKRQALSPASAQKLAPVVQAALMAVPEATKQSSYQVLTDAPKMGAVRVHGMVPRWFITFFFAKWF